MDRHLRIAVADDEADTRAYFQEVLARLGHEVVCAAANGRQLVDECRAAHPDLVITDIRMPDLDGLAAAEEIARDRPTPVILVSDLEEATLLERAAAGHVYAYLIKPIKSADLVPAITLALRRFEQFQAVSKEAADLRQALDDRKLIERAKGAIAKRLQLEEQDSFRRLKKLASDGNQKLVEAARLVLSADQVFQALDRS